MTHQTLKDTRQNVTGLELDHSYQIREGDPVALALKVHPVRLDNHAPSIHDAKAQTKR